MARKTKFSFSLDEQNLKAIGRLVALCCVADSDLWKRAKHCLSHPADFLRKYLAESVDKIELGDDELSTEAMETLRQVKEWPEYVGVKDRIACWSGFFAVLDERKLTNWYASNKLIMDLFDRMTNEIGISAQHFAQVTGLWSNTIIRIRNFEAAPSLPFFARMATTLSMDVGAKGDEDSRQELYGQFQSASEDEVWEQMRIIAENRMRQIKNSEENGNS